MTVNIVINAFSARLGGGQTYLTNLLAHLPKRPDLAILIYAPASLQFPADERISRGITRWPCTNPLVRAAWEALALPSILARTRAKVLFCPGGTISTRVPRGCKTVTMFRNMIPFDPAARARVRFGLQRLRNVVLHHVMLRSLANADLSIFISDHARGVIEKLVPIRNAVTIVHGISSAFRSHGMAIDRPALLPPGEYLLYVSRFDVYKHQYEVAVAFTELAEPLRRRYKLVLAGELDTKLVQAVTDLAAARGLQDSVIVLGPVPYNQLPAFYRNATVNLFASSCENCPNILLEALGAGRPVLSSNVMPMPEFGADAVQYFSPTDPASIRDALQSVLQSETESKRLGEAAAHRSAAFDWTRTAACTWSSIMALATR